MRHVCQPESRGARELWRQLTDVVERLVVNAEGLV